MARRAIDWTVVGVPSSAGGHTPGMDLAPAALRDAGLVAELTARGHSVLDAGDVPGFRRRPDPEHLDRQNIGEVARVARDTAAAVREVVHSGRIPLVLGGDCTVTVGVVAGFRAADAPAALLYMDGGPDLYTPGRIAYGNVDAMGVAHLLALPGSDPVLATVGGPPPQLDASRVVFYGDALPEDDSDLERRTIRELGIPRIPATEVHADPAGAAERALAAVRAAGERFILHLDVDVLGHRHLPLANMPNPDAEPWGLDVDEVVAGLRAFTADDRFAGLVLTEVNPANAPDPSTLVAYVRMIADGVGRVTGSLPTAARPRTAGPE